MILSNIRKYFSSQRVASLTDLSMHFGVTPDAMRGMLEQWVNKRKLRKLPQRAPCPNCCGACNSDNFEIYEWLE